MVIYLPSLKENLSQLRSLFLKTLLYGIMEKIAFNINRCNWCQRLYSHGQTLFSPQTLKLLLWRLLTWIPTATNDSTIPDSFVNLSYFILIDAMIYLSLL